MKKFCSVVLGILFTFALFGTLLLFIVRKNVSSASISNVVTQAITLTAASAGDDLTSGIKDVVEENGIENVDANEVATFVNYLTTGNYTNEVNNIVQSTLKENGIEIDASYVTEALNDDVTKQFISSFLDQTIQYITDEKQDFDIDSKEVSGVVNHVIDKFEEASGEKIDRTGLDEAISKTIDESKDEIKTELNSVKEEMGEDLTSIKELKSFVFVKLIIICVVSCVVLALLIFLVNMHISPMLKCVSIPGIIDGLILAVAGIAGSALIPMVIKLFVPFDVVSGTVLEIINTYANMVLKDLKLFGAISFVVSIVLLVLSIIFGKKKQTETVIAK